MDVYEAYIGKNNPKNCRWTMFKPSLEGLDAPENFKTACMIGWQKVNPPTHPEVIFDRKPFTPDDEEELADFWNSFLGFEYFDMGNDGSEERSAAGETLTAGV